MIRENIPVGVARSVLASQWFAQQVEQDESLIKMRGAFEAATKTKYRQSWAVNTSEQAQHTVDVLRGVAEEMLAAGTATKVVQPIVDFVDAFARNLDYLKAAEEREVQTQAAKAAQEKARSRKFATEQREETMSVAIERGRIVKLKEVAEDYQLDYRDPKIKAGLIAAFHAGAEAFAIAAFELRFDREIRVSEAQWTRFRESDVATFEAARAALTQEAADE